MKLFGMIGAPTSGDCTDVTLRSFLAHTPLGPDDRLLLVDRDGGYVVPGDLAAAPIVVIRAEAFWSFAACANRLLAAARDSDADLLLLAGTLVFTDGWLTPLLAKHRALISAVSNTQVRHTIGEWSAGVDLDPADCVGREAELDQIAAHHRAVQGRYQVVSSTPFYCVRIPRAAYGAVGDFDERFQGEAACQDYALRAWRADVRQELALGSYVLRVQSGSAYRRAQTVEVQRAHEAREAAAFREKWGAALTYALIGDDWHLFRSDPELAALLDQQRYHPVIERLLERPALEPFIERQRQATFGAVCCIYDDDSWLDPAIESVYATCDTIWFLVSDRPWNGQASDQEPLIARIRALPDPAGKIRIVRGSWQTETDQRNEGLRMLAEAGLDYCFVIDADEIHEPAQLGRLVDLVRGNPQIDCWRLYLLDVLEIVPLPDRSPAELCGGGRRPCRARSLRRQPELPGRAGTDRPGRRGDVPSHELRAHRRPGPPQDCHVRRCLEAAARLVRDRLAPVG